MRSRWVRVIPTDSLVVGHGVGALVGDECVAVFRLPNDKYAVIGGVDPHSGANVMAHGLTGSVEINGEQVAFVASPLDKRRYRLDTGDALEEGQPGLGCSPYRIIDDIVEVAPLIREPV